VSRIIDIRGTNGSGKTYLVRELIERLGGKKSYYLEDDADRIIGYTLQDGTGLLGPYEKAVSGGCDQIRTMDQVCDLVRDMVDDGHHTIILEGYIVSHTFSRWHAMAKEMKKRDYKWHFRFLETELEECIRRVKLRRAARGNTNPYDPKNLTRDWHRSRKVVEQFLDAGHDVSWITDVEDIWKEFYADRQA